MESERLSTRSRRILQLTEKLRSKRYRDGYVGAHNRRFLAQQIRSLRGDMSQEEFGKLIGKPQSVVSRLEDPTYGKFTQQTLHEVASSLDRAVITRIVDFQTFLRFTEDLSEHALSPAAYDTDALDRFATSFEAATSDDDAAENDLPAKDSVLSAKSLRDFNGAPKVSALEHADKTTNDASLTKGRVAEAIENWTGRRSKGGGIDRLRTE